MTGPCVECGDPGRFLPADVPEQDPYYALCGRCVYVFVVSDARQLGTVIASAEVFDLTPGLPLPLPLPLPA